MPSQDRRGVMVEQVWVGVGPVRGGGGWGCWVKIAITKAEFCDIDKK
jgi:hypothetical protein